MIFNKYIEVFKKINGDFENNAKAHVISCGEHNYLDKIDAAAALFNNDVDINNFNNFIKDGGVFRLEGKNMFRGNCDYGAKIVSISHHHIVDAMKRNDYSDLSDTLAHEVLHYDDIKKLDKAGILDIHRNEKGEQKLTNALEISVFCKQAIVAFEQGNEKWKGFSLRNPKSTAFFKDLELYGIMSGHEIPDRYLVAVNDALIRDFALNIRHKNPFYDTRKSDYHNQTISGIRECNNFNMEKNITSTKDISLKEIFSVLDMPTSFTEKQLEALVLINYDNIGFFSKIKNKMTTEKYSMSRITNKNKSNVAKALDKKIAQALKNASFKGW